RIAWTFVLDALDAVGRQKGDRLSGKLAGHRVPHLHLGSAIRLGAGGLSGDARTGSAGRARLPRPGPQRSTHPSVEIPPVWHWSHTLNVGRVPPVAPTPHTPARKTRREQQAETRAQVIAAARTIFLERGYHGASLSAVV